MLTDSAYDILERSIIRFRGEPVGTAAACDPNPVADNYKECFVRDFAPSGIVFLLNGRSDIVRNFLGAVMDLRGQQPVLKGHHRSRGIMPASFRVQVNEDGQEVLAGDFGDRAIGRVTPVDSAMWWMFLLRAYLVTTGDWDFVRSDEVQTCIREVLDLYLLESFEMAPTLLVPDGSFMIDRRMAVYGHPLEIQALYFGMLTTARELLQPTSPDDPRPRNLRIRVDALRGYVKERYWVDRPRLNEIHRYQSEQYGEEVANVLNVYPESIPAWMDGWLDEHSGFLVGNKGPGRVDFRFFAQGNLLSVLFGLVGDNEATALMKLYERHWDLLVGEMPLKIVYPALEAKEWMYLTGSDPKNVAWSYHNGGNWPVLLWPFVGAALRAGRGDLAQQAVAAVERRIEQDDWPEYYDGRRGDLIGRRSNFFQVWSVTALIIANEILDDPAKRALFNLFAFTDEVQAANFNTSP
ncbi:MAG: glycoside hydrolase 100 family protein [Gammaproteobacteria bacterium]